MLNHFRSQLEQVLQKALQESFPGAGLPAGDLEVPADKNHGEFSTSVALRSAKILKKSPMMIAQEFLPVIRNGVGASFLKDKIAHIEVKNPGFINFFLSPAAFCEILTQIFKEKENYGRADFGKGEKVQIEFVSANPTGPLSVAHARQAAVGDALANILKCLGFDVHREYYVNDGGNQIKKLGESIRCRAIEILGGQAEFPEDGYQGEYIKDMARLFMDKVKVKSLDDLTAQPTAAFSTFGKDYLLGIIRKELDDFGVHFDHWAYESKIATPAHIEETLFSLQKKGMVYEQDGAQWFRTTDFGDDKDRVVRKSDGSFTYLMPDIVYHKDKFSRGFSRVFNLLGPDHHGYIPRLKAAAVALGKKKEDLEVLIVQLATIYRQGQKVSMSTRGGKYISMREVMEEVGVDAARFFFLMRHIKVHLDFDLDLAKKETPENPVYYIQYAHARIHSINVKAKDIGVAPAASGFQRLKEPEELDLIKKLGSFQDALLFCYNQLDPYPLVSYLQDLAGSFHKFYDTHKVLGEEPVLSSERLALVNAARIVFADGLRLLGVGTPEKM